MDKQVKARYKKLTENEEVVKCQGCGKEIQDTEDNIEYVKTKRGTELFFHSVCRDSVWRHGIC